MLSLNRHDRLRLINFGSDARAAVRIAILNFYQTKEPEERKYYGAFEYKVYLQGLFYLEKPALFCTFVSSFSLLDFNSFPLSSSTTVKQESENALKIPAPQCSISETTDMCHLFLPPPR